MKHTFILEVDASGTLDRSDLQDWLETALKSCKHFDSGGQVYNTTIKDPIGEQQPKQTIMKFGSNGFLGFEE